MRYPDPSDPRRPRVLIIHPALAPYRVDLFNAIAEMVDLKLVFMKRNVGTQAFDQEALTGRLSFRPTYAKGRIRVLGKGMALIPYSMVRDFRPDVVVTMEFSPTTALMMLYRLIPGRRFRSVVWTDDNAFAIDRDRPVRRWGRRVLLPFIHGWIFTSRQVRDFYAGHFGTRGSAAVMPIIHREDEFRAELAASGPVAETFLTKYGLAGKQAVLFVGRLVEQKGVDLLLQAFALLHARRPDTILIVIGDGDRRPELVALSKALGLADNVLFAGRFEGPELYAWYRIGQVFVLASRHEPYGAVVNEALLAGMPAVVSECAGAADLVEAGANGAVVVPEDTAALAAAVEHWLPPEVLTDVPPPLRASLMRTSFEQGLRSMREMFETLATRQG